MAKQESEHRGEKKGCWIFISHAGEDYEMVKKIRNEFEALGHNPLVFYLKCLDSNTSEEEDESQKKDEEEKEHELESLLYREIEARDWFVICDSKAAEGKKYVQQEWADINKIQSEKGNKKIWAIDMSQDEESILEHVRQISKDIKVFVSYTVTDWPLIEPLIKELKNRDYDVEWKGEYASRKSTNDEYRTLAKDSGIIIFTFTPYSSKYEYEELEQEIINTKNNGTKIMTVLINNPTIPAEFTSLFNEIGDDKKISISLTNEGYIQVVNLIDQCLAGTINGENDRAFIRRSKSKNRYIDRIPLENKFQKNNLLPFDYNINDNEPNELEYKNYLNASANQEDATTQKYWEEAQVGNAESEYNIGRRYYDNQDYDKAIEVFNMLAEKGNVDAQNTLGVCYELGQGVDKDEKKAIELYKKSADNGNVKAIRNLGLCYEKGTGVLKNEELAFALYKEAAERGYVLAQMNLGRCYDQGIGVQKDDKKAAEWYMKAAEQGDADAQRKLGFYYYYGNGVARNFKEAFDWFKKAAEQGDATAQFAEGHCFYKGEGVEQDYDEAFKCYTKAAKQGNDSAQIMLGLCYEKGNGTDKNYEEAFKSYLQAAEKGNALAQGFVGDCYYNGEGVAQNYEKAFIWYIKSAEQGDALSECRLGDCYSYSQGVACDYHEAYKWYEESAEQGNDSAQNNLGLCYLNGQGVACDYDKAYKWLELAAEQGNSEALYNLGVCYEKGLGATQDIDKAIDCYSKSKNLGYGPAEKRLNELQKKD